MAYCKLCGKQGIGSTIKWKPRLANYKSHIILSCQIAKHFIEECKCQLNPCKSLGFILLYTINNTESLTLVEIDKLLLEKEKFWIGTLVTQHKGLNGSHDWNRSNHSERPKI